MKYTFFTYLNENRIMGLVLLFFFVCNLAGYLDGCECNWVKVLSLEGIYVVIALINWQEKKKQFKFKQRSDERK